MTEDILYTQMDLGAMFRRYNEEAARRGAPRMRVRPKDRSAMCKELALLTSQPKPKITPPAPVANVPPRVKKHNEIRAAAVEELCAVSHFELVQTGRRITVEDATNFSRNLLMSFGFPYAEILKRMKKRLPRSKITGPKLRVHATNIRSRKSGYEGAKLPDRRPHSSKGVRHGR
jgi:hypothetical protein